MKKLLFFMVLALQISLAHSTCSITIVPGVSFGVIKLGASSTELRKLLKPFTEDLVGKDSFIKSPPFNVHLINDKASEVWVNDVRKELKCVSINGTPLNLKIDVKNIPKVYGPCQLEDRDGGSFYHCMSNQVHFGFGMGHFLQLRVTR